MRRNDQEEHFFTPEMADLCNINSNRKWADFSLNRYWGDFKSLWGPNGTKTAILIYNKHIIWIENRGYEIQSSGKNAPLDR